MSPIEQAKVTNNPVQSVSVGKVSVSPSCDMAQVAPSRHEHAFAQIAAPICWHKPPEEPPPLSPQVARERQATTNTRIFRITHFTADPADGQECTIPPGCGDVAAINQSIDSRMQMDSVPATP